MNKQEYYDPNAEKESLHFYSSIEERESFPNAGFKEKQKISEERARRSRRIILADMIILCLLFLFFTFAYPYLLSTKTIEGIRLHGSLLHHDVETQKIWCFVKMKNSTFDVDTLSTDNKRSLLLKVSYGSQQIEKELPIPPKGEIEGIDFGFDLEKGASYFFVTAQIQKEGDPITKKLQIPVKKYTFLF